MNHIISSHLHFVRWATWCSVWVSVNAGLSVTKLQLSRQWRVSLFHSICLGSFCPSRQTGAKQDKAAILLSTTPAIFYWTLETNNCDDNNKKYDFYSNLNILSDPWSRLIKRKLLCVSQWTLTCRKVAFLFKMPACWPCRAEVLWSESELLECSSRRFHWRVLLA